jgi:hypothetical protein
MVKFKSVNCFVDRGQLTTVNWVGGDAHAPDALGHLPLRTNAPRVRGITGFASVQPDLCLRATITSSGSCARSGITRRERGIGRRERDRESTPCPEGGL